MRHPHIVQMRAVIETADWVYIVMELLEGGELQENIEIRKAYSEADAAEVMLRLGLTLGFLHCQGLPNPSAKSRHTTLTAHVAGIAHRDIKPENILCGMDHIDIKLADFGLANISVSHHTCCRRASAVDCSSPTSFVGGCPRDSLQIQRRHSRFYGSRNQ